MQKNYVLLLQKWSIAKEIGWRYLLKVEVTIWLLLYIFVSKTLDKVYTIVSMFADFPENGFGDISLV